MCACGIALFSLLASPFPTPTMYAEHQPFSYILPNTFRCGLAAGCYQSSQPVDHDAPPSSSLAHLSISSSSRPPARPPPPVPSKIPQKPLQAIIATEYHKIWDDHDTRAIPSKVTFHPNNKHFDSFKLEGIIILTCVQMSLFRPITPGGYFRLGDVAERGIKSHVQDTPALLLHEVL